MNEQTELYKALRKYKPHKVHVYADVDDDEPRSVAVPKTARRWPGVHDAIEARDWHHVVFLDGDGDELATIEARPSAAAAAAALPATGRPLETDLEVAMRFVDRAMDKAFALRRDETSAVLRTVADQAASFGLVVKELASSISAIGELNRQHVAALVAAQAESGDDADAGGSKLTPKEWAELAALVAPGLAPHVMPILQPMLPGLLEKFLPMAAQAVAPELAKVVAPGIQVRTEAPPADAKPANGANGKH